MCRQIKLNMSWLKLTRVLYNSAVYFSNFWLESGIEPIGSARLSAWVPGSHLSIRWGSHSTSCPRHPTHGHPSRDSARQESDCGTWPCLLQSHVGCVATTSCSCYALALVLYIGVAVLGVTQLNRKWGTCICHELSTDLHLAPYSASLAMAVLVEVAVRTMEDMFLDFSLLIIDATILLLHSHMTSAWGLYQKQTKLMIL